MKRFILTCVAAVMVAAVAFGQEFTEAEIEQFNQAFEYSDTGKADKAIEIYNRLLKTHPTDTTVLYEIGYCLYQKQDYAAVDKHFSKLEKKGLVSSGTYVLHGNALDNMGKTKEAMDIYKKGIEMYPNQGRLYLELGTVYRMQGNLTEAVNMYSYGIENDPWLTSNYFRNAQILCYSNEPVLGMFDAEVHQLLDPSSDRSSEMSKAMFEAFSVNVEVKNDTSLVYHYTSNTEITADNDGNLDFPFGLLFEVFSKTPLDMVCWKEKGLLDIPTITAKKQRFVEEIYTNDIFERYRTPIMAYEKAVLDAGHWEAFCMWLLRKGDFDAFDAWLVDNDPKFTAFANWYAENQFNPER